MKIGFDVSATGELKGCGRLSLDLLTALANDAPEHEYLAYRRFGDPRVLADDDVLAGLVRQGVTRHEGVAQTPRTDGGPPVFSADDDVLGNPQIIHSNNWRSPGGARRAATIYTVYDLSFIDSPDTTTEGNRAYCFGGIFRAAVGAETFLAISAYTRRRFLDTFPHISGDRVFTVRLGSRFASAGEETPLRGLALEPGGFWLSVGTIEPRKNYRTLVEAYRRFMAKRPDGPPLVIAGGRGWLMQGFEDEVRDLTAQGKLALPGFTSDAELRWLYKNCIGLMNVSLYEGFGLPAAEAMSLGAPVITGSETALPEVAGDAALIVDPRSPDAIHNAMERMLTDEALRARLTELGYERAKQYTWANAARDTLAAYEATLARR